MSSVRIVKVADRKGLEEFIQFHYDLYRGDPYDVPNLRSDELRTLSTGIALRYLGELSYDWSLVNTISVVAMLPMILLFFFFQKYMVKGLVAGAVKG